MVLGKKSKKSPVVKMKDTGTYAGIYEPVETLKMEVKVLLMKPLMD